MGIPTFPGSSGNFRNLPESSGILRNLPELRLHGWRNQSKANKNRILEQKMHLEAGKTTDSQAEIRITTFPGSPGIFRTRVCMSGGTKAKPTKIDFWNEKCISKSGNPQIFKRKWVFPHSRDLPESSGIFRDLPGSSGIFRNCVCMSGGTKAKPTKIGFWSKKIHTKARKSRILKRK